MGIPSYFVSLLKANAKLMTKATASFNVDGLYFDANSIIYDIIKELENDQKITPRSNDIIYENVCKKLISYIEKIRPSKEVFISFDGVSPSAKLEQQRQRRYKSQLMMDIKNLLHKNEAFVFNTNQITPGTQFMTGLCDYVNKYFKNHQIATANKGNLTIVLSLSNVPGEGEHKLFNYIRNNHKTLLDKYSMKTYNHVVYGLDSDLIMLSLINCDVVDNIYLLRETPHFISKINSNYSPHMLYYIDFHDNKTTITQDVFPDDYILLGFILGNDFIPHNPAFNIRNNGFEKIISLYKETFSKTLGKRNLTLMYKGKKTINMSSLKKFFTVLASVEEMGLRNNIETKHKMSSKFRPTIDKNTTLDDKLNMIPKMDFNLEHTIFNSNQWKKNYYKTCLDTNYNNQQDRNAIIENYLDAIVWNFDYYTQKNTDVFWKYNFHYSPLISDVVDYMDDYDSSSRFNTECCLDITKNIIHPQTQLAYVLPEESYTFLDENIRSYVIKNHPHIIHHNMEYKYAFSSYLWEGSLDLNYVNIQELNSAILNKIKSIS